MNRPSVRYREEIDNSDEIYLKREADPYIKMLEEKNQKFLSCMKCLVQRDLVKDCPEKAALRELVAEETTVCYLKKQ
jgi:hypothetical protein